ncbi:MAG: ATP-dependent Clp protease ATP-binding subunit, partial [Clostridia bacterium]|nr:ATP-dependent Clp protease ATP-binding subunit [Clostridia bacterium]
MLCCKCKKNLAVVYISRMDEEGKAVNEGYCLTCAKELNIGPVNEMMEKMGINPEEMDGLNKEMSAMMEEMGDQFPGAEGMSAIFGGEMEEDEEDDDGQMSRSMQKNPFELMNRLFGGNKAAEQSGEETGQKDEKKASGKSKKEKKKKKNLDMYAVNLTEKARNGLIDRVVGRDVELERTAQILNRRTKNNPCLIGEPGVGKTAIAEGLALRIVKGEVPAKLLRYEIYLLDMTAVVAGTQFRGQFESRLRNIIEEVKQLGNVILVIDEIHTIASAGDAEGGMNAGNILKPALSRGEIQVIGATTIEEYRKHIEKDAALERRFQTIMVEEPSIEETVEILKGIKEYYEDYHKVRISDELIRTATILAERYINDRFLPDKAIDVIDEAASKANLDNIDLVTIAKLKAEVKEVEEELEQESSTVSETIEEFQKVADLKSKKCQLEEQIAKLEKKPLRELTVEDIAAVIELWTKIPVKHISEYETNRLINLEERLHQRLIGQDEAVESVSRAIRRKRAGISLKRRPVSFIFVGPTGVGKTELVKQIAREVFDGEDALIRLDMSEYMEKHSVAKLIGSPPGYVGYDDAGQLTEKIRRRPYSVILLDEIEKAHEDVFNILLQILDDGRITDSHGKTVSFENTIIVMTSNAGSDQRTNVVGFWE